MHKFIGIPFLLLIAGCASSPPRENLAAEKKTPAPPPKTRVSNRQGNKKGDVLILEYHRISKEEARWDRSQKAFLGDLERLYKLGFRPVTLSEFLESRMDLPPGASPVVLTFDDSPISQFKLAPDETLDPGCALGIWNSFSSSHPDFPIKATFYILPPNPWGQPTSLAKKLEMLKKWGCEVGSHTMTHPSLAKLTDAQVKQELEKSKEWIKELGFEPKSLSLPMGISPKNRALTHIYDSIVLVGSGPVRLEKLDPHRLPRIQAINGDFGVDYWLNKVEDGSVKPYVQP